jgi:rhodanese-related sulfurtransferase
VTRPAVPETDVPGALEQVQQGALLLDVREPFEWQAGHAPGAVHTPLGSLDPAAVPGTGPVVVICRSGNRSAYATAALLAVGRDAVNVAGGMQAWSAAGHPVVRDDDSPGQVQ